MDFDSCVIDTGLWTVYDAVGDAIVRQTGTTLEIDLPAGVEHDVWGSGSNDFFNNTVHLMQPAVDDDFVLEVKLMLPLRHVIKRKGSRLKRTMTICCELSYWATTHNPHFHRQF